MVAASDLGRVNASPVKQAALAEARVLTGLHFEVDLSAVGELNEDIKHGAFFDGGFLGGVWIEDGDIHNGSCRPKDGSEQRDEHSAIADVGKKKFEYNVKFRVECAPHPERKLAR